MGSKIFDDALITIGVFMAVEKWFEITLQDYEIQDIKTIEELVELIKSKK
jgi:acyl carrier protein